MIEYSMRWGLTLFACLVGQVVLGEDEREVDRFILDSVKAVRMADPRPQPPSVEEFHKK